MDPETIAEEVEEPLDKVQAICNFASKCNPDYNPKAILEELSDLAIK